MMMRHMTATKGVLTIASGQPKYARQAIDLARSIRLHDLDLPLAVATDLDAALFAGMYDFVIPWDFTQWQGLLSKLEAYDATPFDTTLFLDADCLAVRSLHEVFDLFGAQQFGVYGTQRTDAIWFRGIEDRIGTFAGTDMFPVFNGGLYFFRKSELAADIFRRAKALKSEYDVLGLRRHLHQSYNEEPLVSLAMVQAGLTATNSEHLDVMHTPELPHCEVDFDILDGRCSFIRRGRLVRPAIVHFVGQRKKAFAYTRERKRLAAAYPSGRIFPLRDAFVQMSAYVAWRRAGRQAVL